MGSKTAAREKMIAAGVPTVPGSEGAVQSEEELGRLAKDIGYPLMLKASAGGGGKGMRLIESESELASAYRSTRSEAKSAFGDATVYLEKFIERPRHVEIQIMSGPDGKTVWLGERECSMQRRHQKVIEETPSTAITAEVRRQMGEVACRAAEAVDYVGAGTVEFLVDPEQNFYFLEMNTRLQVEHPVTELCTGIDLVESQVRVAQGEALPYGQDDIRRVGHAIETRIYAEDPDRNFMPAPGSIAGLAWPQGPGVRIDGGVSAGFEVPRHYDPMIAKLVVWADDRDKAIARMDRALGELTVRGITTNTSFLRRLLTSEAFVSGDYHTGTIATLLEGEAEATPERIRKIAIAASVVHRFRRDEQRARRSAGASQGQSTASAWRTHSWRWGGR